MAAVVQHGDGAGTELKKLTEIAGLSDAWKDAVVDVGPDQIPTLDLTQYSRKDLSDDPEDGGLILLLILDDGCAITKEDLDYLAIACETLPKYLREYIMWFVLFELDVPSNRWKAALTKRFGKKNAEASMQIASKAYIAERERICKAQGVVLGKAQGVVLGKAQGKAQGEVEALTMRFLKTAKQRFQEVPKDLTNRLRGKSADQIDALYDLMLTAPDIDSVFIDRSHRKRNGKGKG